MNINILLRLIVLISIPFAENTIYNLLFYLYSDVVIMWSIQCDRKPSPFEDFQHNIKFNFLYFKQSIVKVHLYMNF